MLEEKQETPAKNYTNQNADNIDLSSYRVSINIVFYFYSKNETRGLYHWQKNSCPEAAKGGNTFIKLNLH